MEDENNPWAHCMVMWGNLLYEASQMYAAAGRPDWKATLDNAADNFRAAGCPENDIRAALGNHTQAEHLDLPPLKVPAPSGSLLSTCKDIYGDRCSKSMAHAADTYLHLWLALIVTIICQ